jgi:hypothetical protein
VIKTKIEQQIANLEDVITTLIETYPFEDCDPFIKPVR